VRYTVSRLLGVIVEQRRILVKSGDKFCAPVVPTPILSSAATAWEGFLFEHHSMPPVVEFPPSMSFPGHLIGITLCDEPPITYWRDRGVERSARLLNGQVGLISSQELIAARQAGASMIHNILIPEATMERVCAELPKRGPIELIPCPNLDDDALRHLILAMGADLKEGCPTGRIFGESIANTIAAYSAQKYASSSCYFQEFRDGLSRHCLRKVLDYIQSNLHRDLGVTEIAHVALISPYYFGKLFKRSTGHTLHQYVLDQRIKKAQGYLASTNMALAEIAAAVGLANQSHFTTAFKKKMCCTPGFYRASVRG